MSHKIKCFMQKKRNNIVICRRSYNLSLDNIYRYDKLRRTLSNALPAAASLMNERLLIDE